MTLKMMDLHSIGNAPIDFEIERSRTQFVQGIQYFYTVNSPPFFTTGESLLLRTKPGLCFKRMNSLNIPTDVVMLK